MGQVYDTVIIGGGVSGLGAALYAGRFQMNTVLIAEKKGGTIVLAPYTDNFPGFGKITGLELAQRIEKHARGYGTEFVQGKVTGIEKSKGNTFTVSVPGRAFRTKTVILATGTDWRKLDVKGEKEFAGNGVHYCALCDAPLYKGKVIGVVGGSDTAAKEALLLAEYAMKVFIIYRKEKPRAEPVILKRVMENKKIEIINNTNVLEIRGNGFVKSVALDRPFRGSKELKLDALFVAIGRVPLSGLAEQLGVKLNDKKEIIVGRECNTSIAGIFAAGDVVDKRFKQAITGVAEGAQAAYSAYHYIAGDR